VIDADGKVVCPAFVDPHTHIVYAGDRLDEFELKIKGRGLFGNFWRTAAESSRRSERRAKPI
jgi:imidazolonepropionase